MKVSRKDIAAAAKVSVSTVGMILSGQGERYSEETRQRVLEAAAQLGYQPSINARALRLNRSLLIGVLFSEMNLHAAARFLTGVQEAISHTQYSPLVFFSKAPEDQEACLQHCLNREVDALLVNCAVDPAQGRPDRYFERLSTLPIPVVEVFGHFLTGVPQTNIDNHRAGELITRHLIELGHRRIALLTHSRYHSAEFHADAWEQAGGYRAAMEAAVLAPIIAGVDIDFVEPTVEGYIQAGEEALAGLLEQPDPPTAVICYNDYLGYGVNQACGKRGIRVPHDLSIAGNGNLLLSGIMDPPLTTIRPRFFEIGRLSVEGLLGAIQGGSLASQSVEPELIVRRSTAAVA